MYMSGTLELLTKIENNVCGFLSIPIDNCVYFVCSAIRICPGGPGFYISHFYLVSFVRPFQYTTTSLLMCVLFLFVCFFFKSWVFVCFFIFYAVTYIHSFYLQLAVDLDLLEEFWQQPHFLLWTQGFREC